MPKTPNAVRMRLECGVLESAHQHQQDRRRGAGILLSAGVGLLHDFPADRRYSAGSRNQRLSVLRSMPATRAVSAWFLSASKAAMAASFFRPNFDPCPFTGGHLGGIWGASAFAAAGHR
jgi:hypothetical protein